MTKTFKTLYKQTSKGKVQQWTISVDKNKITTEYGLTDGKLQTTVDIVKEGKNLGRANATTPETQAMSEAESSFEAKLKEGYVENKQVASTTKNTLVAVEPMLAHPIENKEKYVVFPALAQPKLDGLRCLAIMKEGKVKLYSRTQKEYTTMPHIVKEIEKIFGAYEDLVLDGELYNHRFKKNFNKITEIIKRDDIHPEHELVEYHVYDVAHPNASMPYKDRTCFLEVELNGRSKFLKQVETRTVNSRDELESYQAECVENGYEGCMYRNPSYAYENKRSAGLLKVKTFKDAEFKIVETEEGRGKLMGHIGAFYCELKDGRQFKATPAVTLEEKKRMWEERTSYIGRMATIKFQNYTPDGIPRFPIFKAVRDELD